MGRLFGTDGVRGVANSELTPELAFKLGKAGAHVLSENNHDKPVVLIGKDTRISGDMLEEGSACVTMSSLSRTSLVASLMSMPYSNSNEMTDMFSFDVEERCFKLLTLLRAFSKGFVTLVSMSAALAPEYEVTTKMVFSPMSGKRLVDNLVRENTPRIATVMNMRATVTGLFTDVLYKLIS